MTLRALLLGLLVGFGIAGVTYFNDAVMHQTFLIGNFFPIVVFGLLTLLLMVNLALRYLGPRWPLRPSELVVMTAIGLAVCGWPSSGFFRTFTTTVTLPSQFIKNQANWQATNVMSYVPGGSAVVAEGHVRDWPGLVKGLAAAEKEVSGPKAKAWELEPDWVRLTIREAERTGRIEDSIKPDLLMGLKTIVESRTFYGAFDPETTSERAQALLVEREEAIAERGRLADERDELAKQRDAVNNEIRDELANLENPRKALREDRAARSKERDDLAAQTPGQAGPEVKALDALIADLDARTAELDSQIADLTAPVRKSDRKIQALARKVAYLDGQIGSGPKTGQNAKAGRLEKKVNRVLLEDLFAGAIGPSPEGGGVLLDGGEPDPFAVDTLQQGWSGGERLGLTDLPWDVWWPTLKVWGITALLVAGAALCLVLIVHIQWSHRELLPYPIARFVEETARTGPDGRDPVILRSKVFWYGFAAVAAVHLINGLNAWFPNEFFLQIPMTFWLQPLVEAFPGATKVPQGWGAFAVNILPSVVAFTYFLSSEVSFSLGIANIAWVLFGSLFISNGIAIEHEYLGGKNLNLILFGAYLGSAVMILYIGRRYYLNVAASAVGFRRQTDTPRYATWAARILVLCVAGAAVVLSQAGLDWPLSILLVLLVLVMLLVLTRINAETGAIFIQPYWMPVGVITALFGVQAISPQAYIVLALACVVLVCDPREAIMPYLANGLRLAESGARVGPQRIAPVMGLMLVGGFVVALMVTFMFQYNLGVNHADGWATGSVPPFAFDALAAHIGNLSARGDLAATTAQSGLESLASIRLGGVELAWLGLGAGLVVACSIARLRLSWWFIHPVLFLFWATYPSCIMASSFLIGWGVKASVVKLGGAKTYNSLKPASIGIIAGELVAGIAWILVGAAYYAVTHKFPTTYRILPG